MRVSTGAAARRLLVEDRDVELAVDGPRQRTRDRRGRHDEDVRRIALAEEARAVGHAEAVLLVHDDQAQPVEADGRLDRARASRPGRRAPRPPGARAASCARPRARARSAGRSGSRPRSATTKGSSRAARRGSRSAPSAPPAPRSWRRSGEPVPPPPSCRTRRRPGAGGPSPARSEIVGDLPHRPLLSVRQRKRQDVAGELPDRLLGRRAPCPGARAGARRFSSMRAARTNSSSWASCQRRRSRRVRRESEKWRPLARALRICGRRRGDRRELGREPVEHPAHEGAPEPGRTSAARW